MFTKDDHKQIEAARYILLDAFRVYEDSFHAYSEEFDKYNTIYISDNEELQSWIMWLAMVQYNLPERNVKRTKDNGVYFTRE